ncbi:beta/gamma crystallin domain-containing protein 1 isoform X1 [Corvus cornix cornix]|uniref:beta/gamma crystallin domain-containing protein 1 isoform X1 n=2 Tax=Corvus cornix cornix TaxID=932674 RepID=UPI00194FB810|nr:beta/gamma crystallin domain-containing protein 1 isoform X1 [Corvus cornix cornix]
MSTASLPAALRKSTSHLPDPSREENKKKPVLERLGNLFGTGKRKNVKSSLEHTSHHKGERSGSPHGAQPVYCRHFREGHEAPQVQKQVRNISALSEAQEYTFSGEVRPLYHDTISEWSSRGVSSDSEWSADWSGSSETIKNSFCESSLNVETLGLEKESITDISNSTTPDFIQSLRNLSSEDLEKSILSHKQLVSTWVSEEPGHAKPKDLPYELESAASEHAYSARVLTVDIYLRKTDELLNEPVTLKSEENCSDSDTMDKKSASKRSGKRRKSQSSSDIPNGERNQAENTAREEPVFEDDAHSEVFSDKIINSERKVRSLQQTPERNSSSSGNNQDLKVGSAHKGASKAEADKGKQQISNTTSARRRSYKKNQSDSVPISPTGLKGQVKDYSSKRQPLALPETNPVTKRTSVEKGTIPVAFGEDSLESPKASLATKTEDNALVFAEGRNDTKVVKHGNGPDGRAFLHTDGIKNGDLCLSAERQTNSDLDTSKLKSLDASRTVTTKISLPAKPKNIELNFKTPTNQDSLESEQDILEKPVNKTNSNIANKISLFENKCANQSQRPTDIPASKNSTVPSTFVGRAKLKFGKQPKENEQPDKILNKQSSRQKLFENGTQEKESTAELKGKNEEGFAPYEDIGKTPELKVKAAISLFNQSSKSDASSASLKQPEPELTTAKKESSPFKLSLHSPVKSENAQDPFYQRNYTSSEFHRNEEKMLPNTEALSPCNNDKYPLPSHQVSRSEFNKMENGDKKVKPGDLNFAALQYDDSSQDSILESEHNTNTQKSPGKTCNGSAEDDSIFDSPSDMKKFAETIKNLDTSVCLPQKKKRSKLPKSPAPHFAMPPIHEDNLEKVFDPSVFTFGLGLRREKTQDLLPAQQIKMQSLETIARVRPKRASTEQSIIFKSLQSCREEPAFTQEINGKENTDCTDGEVKRSRLEKSSLFSSLLSSKEKFYSPSVTSVNNTTTFATDSSGMLPLQQDASGPFIMPQKSESLSDMKFPSFVEKFLQADSAKKELSLQMPSYSNPEKSFSSWLGTSRYESNVPPGLLDVDTLPRNGQSKINPRPGKLVIYCDSDYQKAGIEVFHDVPDCSSWVLSPTILVKVIRGCWILYEKPNFEGPSIPLEEGELELTDIWGAGTSEEQSDCKSQKPAVIGSIRHVVKDYRVCQIDLYTEPEGLGIVTSFFDDTEETGVFGTTQKTCSIKVHWGIWLLYEEPGFQGVPLMLEPGEYPNLLFWEKKEAYIRSMRPLKMGGRKVEFSGEPKVIVYEKPFFEGRHVEIESEIFMLDDKESEDKTRLPLTSVGSMKVLGGIWVAYEKPGFEGHQYLLEEGAYRDWTDWGGYDEELQSLRPIVGDFTSCHMIMYSEKDFGSKGSNINVLGIISNLKDTGYGLRTQSINVLSGVWVAYENPEFTGEQYILAKGLYPSVEAWGGKNCKISSVQPIVADIVGSERGKVKVQLFSEPEFKGNCQIFEKNTRCIDSFPVKSSKILDGSCIVYDQEEFAGNQYVLEEGIYPDLTAMGCSPQAVLKSLRIINIELSEPCIALFEKMGFQGKKIEFSTEILNLQFLGYNPRIASVQVLGGIWIIYEHTNYRGRQMLLTPNEIPDWYKASGFCQIGSLRPLLQKRVYFRLRNKETGKFMSADGNLDNLNLLRIQVAEDTDSDDQIWVYQDGFIRCRMAEDCCLTIVGNLITPGSKLGLSFERNEDKQYWHISPDGRIYSKMKPKLVLDIKGGTQYDCDHVVVNTASEEKLTQCWEPLVV